MRRTYRSKKDAGGGLDPKDILQTLDDRSSAFDAFYIQNIKQSKQELSCISSSNQNNAAFNKVRKRKYVKRLNKKAEPVLLESLYQSSCLTPDKSIRVNKGPDLFDQLLNSSSTTQTDSSLKNKSLIKVERSVKKAYGNKKTSKFKVAINGSSFDSDSSESDKENMKIKDASNILQHKLQVEKYSKNSRQNIDDSINKIVDNLSLIKDLKNSRKFSINLRKSIINHRLTNSVESPLLDRQSPLSSTPFSNKCRSKSIYKFSPIKIGNFEESPNNVTIHEEIHGQNTSKQVIDIADENHTPKQEVFDDKPSPVLHLSEKVKQYKLHSNPMFDSEDDKSQLSKSRESNSDIIENSPTKTEPAKETFQLTTDEPFYGFGPNPTEDDERDVAEENIHKTDVIDKDGCSIIEFFEINHTTPIEPFLGFTKIDESVCSKSDITETSIDSVQYNSDKNSIHNSSMDSKESSNEDRESFYNTCNSDLSLHDSDYAKKKEPIVEIERLNSSLLQKYYEKMIASSQNEDCSSNSIKSIEVDSDDYDSKNNTFNSSTSYSMETSYDEDKKINHLEISVTNEEAVDISISSNTEEVNEDNSNSSNSNVSLQDEITEVEESEDLNETNDETKSVNVNYSTGDNKSISFVTTRRGNEISNVSLIFLDDSFGSGSSNEFNKTVITKNEEKVNKKVEMIVQKHENKLKRDPEENAEMCSFITNRNSSRITQDSVTDESRKSLPDSNKPSIVLQPGKKWERSLSIYKRMSIMTEHFDESILQDDLLHSKGRKYRQSVINTMEMQETLGSAHNESIVSRRSTFFAKPSRSTIKIVRDHNNSAVSISSSTISEDFNGFLTEDCDDTIVELSKLSIADALEVTAIGRVHDTSGRISTARDYVLRRCNQTRAILFDECYPDTVLKNCHKIGEGVYGEVFLWRASDGARVMKIVPIAGTTKVNGEHQKDFHEIISEIVIAMELSALRAPIREIESHIDAGKDVDLLDLHAIGNATDVFNEVLAVRCVYGHYPSRLLDLWELYDECKGSENDNPAILPRDQQYAVLELANAGQDLESYQFNNAEQAYALFWQIAFGLAVGEEAFQFEHRDLHWGNVLIAPTDQKYATFVLSGRRYSVARGGVAATIIDYSLSRVRLPLAAGDQADLYNDLASDDGLFDAAGDYQFDVYRLMRDKLGNDWKNFEPYTNILWLHYTLDKMITALRYKRTNTKVHKHFISKLNDIKKRILSYNSTVQFVLTDNEL